MNFCGGGVEQQVHEPPIVSMGRHHSLIDGENRPYHHSIDLPVHPTCSVTSSQPQNTIKKSPSSPLKKKKPSSSLNNNKNSKTPPRSRSRSRSRLSTTTTTTTLEENMSGMEISTPARQTSSSAKSSPSPRMLNPLNTPQRIVAGNGLSGGVMGLPSFSNMKTLDTLLRRLENGFRVTIHNGSDPGGKRVFLTLLQNRSFLMIRPIEGSREEATPSVKFPVRTILRLEIGKTKSSVLGRSLYENVHPMTCFSIVVKLWTDAETYFDFEASSVIEREALISTLMVVLDQIHNNKNSNNPKGSSPAGSAGASAWTHPRKGQSTENDKDESPEHRDSCLSPGRRTKIYSSNFFEDNGEDQEGTEISLVYPPPSISRDERLTLGPLMRSPKSSSSSSNPKPLRQRQLQPAVNDQQPKSPPRTPRFRGQSTRDFLNGAKTQSTEVTKRTCSSAPKRPHSSNIPSEVVTVDRREDEQRDSKEDGSFVILSSSHQPETEIEIGLGASPDGEVQADLSFEIAAQGGLPVSQINFSPTRENMDCQTGCCSLVPPNQQGGNANINSQAAWCSDDICTLALKDIADTCTGIFEQHPDALAKDQGHKLDAGGDEEAAERAFVEEYIAGVLGGPTSALGAFFPDGDVWNVDSSKQSQSKVKPNRIKNRASLLNAQALRLRTLRNEMTFAAALKRSKQKMQYVQTTKSFDDADGERIRQAQERSVSLLHTSALMERVMGSMVLSKPEAEEDAVYYDSDPEDVRPRTRGVRRASANRQNAISNDDEHKPISRPVLSGVGFERIAVGKKLRKLDEGLIVQIVQAMRNESLTLMWHPTQSAECPNRSPICVNLWIESGVYLVDGSFLLPRLSWSVAYENNLGSKKLNVSKTEPDQIDLLDVCRIRVTEKIDRDLHPFPDPRKSFVIETQDEIYCFEAQTSDERNRIVYGYKLVIARLASLLMLRDSRAVEEFFGSASAMVPGGFTVGA